MAKGVISLQKESGGVTKITSTDGTGNTELVLPERGTVASVDGSVTDNAIARYDGTTGKLQNSGVIIDDRGSLLLTLGTGALGYGTGAGGTVTQLTNKNFNVTLNKPTGTIITSDSALVSGQGTYFVFLNSVISINDTLIITSKGSINYDIDVIDIYDGAATIRIMNRDSISRSDAIKINFTVVKGATS